MIVIFNEDRLDAIDRDLALAKNGERDADRRVRESHLPWLLHFARHTNEQVAAYEAAMIEGRIDEVVDEVADRVDEILNGEDTLPEGAEGNAPEKPEEATPPNVEEENGTTPSDDPREDSVAEAGSPTALAEDAAIAEAKENNEEAE